MDTEKNRSAVVDGKLVQFTAPVKVDDGLTQAEWDALHCDECGENTNDCYCEQANMKEKQMENETFKNEYGVVYVNVYLEDRAYGGPEEGGWWYNTGVLEECHVMPTKALAEALKDKLLGVAQEDNTQRRSDIGSVLSEGRFSVYIEDHPGADYPKTRPFYE